MNASSRGSATYKATARSYPRQGYGLNVHCLAAGVKDLVLPASHHMQISLTGQVRCILPVYAARKSRPLLRCEDERLFQRR